jgi:hypothetical protein
MLNKHRTLLSLTLCNYTGYIPMNLTLVGACAFLGLTDRSFKNFGSEESQELWEQQ